MKNLSSLKKALKSIGQEPTCAWKKHEQMHYAGVKAAWVIRSPSRTIVNLGLPPEDQMRCGATLDQMRLAHDEGCLVAAHALVEAGFSPSSFVEFHRDISGKPFVVRNMGQLVVEAV